MAQRATSAESFQKRRSVKQEETATIVEATLSAEEFALGDALTARENLAIEIESTVAGDRTTVMPVIRAWGLDPPTTESVLRADPDTEHIQLLAESEDGCLYQIAWSEAVNTELSTVVDYGATILAATATNGRWHFRLLCPTRAGLSHTHQACAEAGFSLEITRIYDAEGRRRKQFDLTEKQREALVAAFEAGYYNVPRAISQEMLADDLGISHQALSERLHRAIEGLIENAVTNNDH